MSPIAADFSGCSGTGTAVCGEAFGFDGAVSTGLAASGSVEGSGGGWVTELSVESADSGSLAVLRPAELTATPSATTAASPTKTQRVRLSTASTALEGERHYRFSTVSAWMYFRSPSTTTFPRTKTSKFAAGALGEAPEGAGPST